MYLVPGSKYGDVRKDAEKRQPTKSSQRVQTPGQRAPGAPANLFIPRMGKEMRFEEWYWRELREGGYLWNYLRQEKLKSRDRLRAVATQHNRGREGFKQNNKSDFRLLAAVPAREFFRWKREDPNFWEDDANLRSFRRDNPDACVYV